MNNKFKAVFMAFGMVAAFASPSSAGPDVNRHSGTYELDWSRVDQYGETNELGLTGSLHGALAFVSSYGAGATGFNIEIPLVPIEPGEPHIIYDISDAFVAAHDRFVDSLDWQFTWFGTTTYYNWLAAGVTFASPSTREAFKDAKKAAAREYADATVANIATQWNLMFESLPGTVHFDTQYGTGLLSAVGAASYYFDDNPDDDWGAVLLNNLRVSLPVIAILDGFMIGGSNPEIPAAAGLACLAWTAADEIGCFRLDEEEPCDLQPDGSCANECTYEGETVDAYSVWGTIAELTCVGGVLPGILFATDVGYGVFGTPRGQLVTEESI
jgi:hypothetical protein